MGQSAEELRYEIAETREHHEVSYGALDLDWNFLGGDYPKPDYVPRVIHYTNGGPWFDEWQDCDFAELWLQERDLYIASGGQVPLKICA